MKAVLGLILALSAVAGGWLLCLLFYGPPGDLDVLKAELKASRKAYSADSTAWVDSIAALNRSRDRHVTEGDSSLARGRRLRQSADQVKEKREAAEAELPPSDSVPTWLYGYAVEEAGLLRASNDSLEHADSSHKAGLRDAQMAANGYAGLWLRSEGQRNFERNNYERQLRAQALTWAVGPAALTDSAGVAWGGMVTRGVRPLGIPLRLSLAVGKGQEWTGLVAAQVVF